jgi:hypothetical protein
MSAESETVFAGLRSIVDTPDQHGFVVSGLQTIFLHHLSMFKMQNHRYQCVLRVQMPEYARIMYCADRQEYPNTTYIIGNIKTDLFTIPELQTGARGGRSWEENVCWRLL